MVSDSISLPSRGSFHLSLTVLCSLSVNGVFSLRRWSSLLLTGFHGSRDTQVLNLRSNKDFVYGAFTLYGHPFQDVQLSALFLTPPLVSRPEMFRPTTPLKQRLQALTLKRFRLFPFRSPLLGESIFLSFPRVTWMFRFTRFPFMLYFIKA